MVLVGRYDRGLLRVLLAAVTTSAALACAPAAPAASGRASGGRVRVGSVARLPAGTRPVAPVSPLRSLHLTVVLRPRAPAALAGYAAAVSDPSSSLFHRFLTPGRFARRFGASPAEIGAVQASLRSHGLRPGAVSANRLAIPVEGSAGAVERAFSVSLDEVRLVGGRTAVVSSLAPALDRSVAGSVQAVIGLNGLDQPLPMLRRSGRTSAPRVQASLVHTQVATGGPQACASARSNAGPNSAYTADQIALAYGFSGLFRRGDKGRGVTVAMYELEPDSRPDIAAYQRCYRTHTSISYVRVDGGSGSGEGQGEAALDIEQVIGLAPRARLLVYQGPNSNSGGPGSGPYDVYSAIINQDRAAVISTSWGECEPVLGSSAAAAESTLFQEAAAQGQTVLAASGDEGSEGCFGQVGLTGTPALPTSLQVTDPASQPFVTGVGGTTLKRLGPPPRETTWNNGGAIPSQPMPGASGGGISRFWRMPVYQASAPTSLRVVQGDSSGSPCGAGSGKCREVPDVSADADPNTGYLIYFNGNGSDLQDPSRGWQGFGGTSAATPVWASLLALADANRACGGIRLGFVNPTLYRIAASSYGAYFNDVTSGNNDVLGTSGGRYPAGRRYDMATGLGTPKGQAVALGLCRQGLRLGHPARQLSRLHEHTTLRLRVFDARGAGVRITVGGLPPGLRLRPSGRRITGRPSRTGTYHVRVQASDRDGAIRVVRFVWKVRRD